MHVQRQSAGEARGHHVSDQRPSKELFDKWWATTRGAGNVAPIEAFEAGWRAARAAVETKALPNAENDPLVVWVLERLENCQEIAAKKTGSDRDGWLDDAQKFAQILRRLCSVSPPSPEPVAWVPVHPRTGPLWSMTMKTENRDVLPHYDLMPLYVQPVAWLGGQHCICPMGVTLSTCPICGPKRS